MRLRPSLHGELHALGQGVDLQEHALHAHLAEDDRAVQDRLIEDGGDHRDEEGDGRLRAFLRLVQVDRLD